MPEPAGRRRGLDGEVNTSAESSATDAGAPKGRTDKFWDLTGPFALEVLPLETFRCEFIGHNWGVPAEFLCYNTPCAYHEAIAFTLLHDILVRNDLEEESKLWKAMDDFGRKRATWLPYWDNEKYVTTDAPEVKVSLYNRPGQGVMAVISNLGRDQRQAQVTFNLAALKQSQALAA